MLELIDEAISRGWEHHAACADALGARQGLARWDDTGGDRDLAGGLVADDGSVEAAHSGWSAEREAAPGAAEGGRKCQ